MVIKMPYTLSPSKLNLMEDCPRCFWLSVVKKINRPSGPMASIVIKIDSITKKYFDKYRQKNELPPILKGKISGTLPLDMPKTLVYSYNENITFVGRPDDYLQQTDGNIVPFDNKTRSKAPGGTHPAYQLQLDSYSFLLEVNNYKTTDMAYLAYYYPNEGELHKGMEISCHVVEVRTNSGRIKSLLNKAHRILNGKIPNFGINCEFCKWKSAW